MPELLRSPFRGAQQVFCANCLPEWTSDQPVPDALVPSTCIDSNSLMRFCLRDGNPARGDVAGVHRRPNGRPQRLDGHCTQVSDRTYWLGNYVGTAYVACRNSVVRELDAADDMDNVGIPGGEFVAEELVVQVVPQRNDEFTCYSCFLVLHRSQIAREKDGHTYCIECEG